jgi:8-oxo-dGTP pyrophosphatase MutT (NUDIX family)
LAKIPFDPEQLPVDSLGEEGALAAERLVADWLRTRFAHPPEWEAEPAEYALMQRPRMTAASVLIPLVLRPEGLTMLLTQRTAHLTDHAGQISFPGGRAEDYDASPVDTALRETEEEIGLDRKHVEILGALPDYVTGTGYRVTPVVGLVLPPFALQPDENEVAEIFEVPLAFLMDAANHRRLSFELPEGAGRRSFYAMPYERFFIWGATAGMLRNLFHFLRA